MSQHYDVYLTFSDFSRGEDGDGGGRGAENSSAGPVGQTFNNVTLISCFYNPPSRQGA